ncbi:UDP-N-acetylglucosamine 2-epimerase [Intrasporangium oryzae NRRL B-24470]|uniref:UDP-N-acetylglucosamine 2-epimerase n=1 Tax=Intrasporangium oryzae NRRL B-24470 TaxID=1386089 RepID=W9G4R5_9MICO|nr:UDP-N-acetylglucosamine 2-epimerase [Intrasporangium oryzae]EWT01126.1 UDP-N-acetylglucosamine 2-epimerase [Intrasporangium oryzae NRRL B-24470]
MSVPPDEPDDSASGPRPAAGSAPVTTVAVFVGTRADLGPLSPVLDALQAASDIDLRILTGVMYAADDLATALPSSFPHDTWRSRIVELATPMDHVSVERQLEQGARLAAAVGTTLPRLGADVLVVLGDRWELLYVVPPAVLLGVPVVHLHGGEVTEGALDERVRHAVTKLADEHCVASDDAARRLAQLGEPPERIHVTGAPGLDRLAGTPALPDADLAELLGIDTVRRPLALFTYHPPTAEEDVPVARWAREAAQAALATCGTVIATHPGMDEGRDAILLALTDLSRDEPRLRLVEALGHHYPRVLAAVDVVVGNSSSGIIEAATAHVAAVDVGERQRGRLRGSNVVHADEGREAVEAAIALALSPRGRELAATVVNPYGMGRASARILDIVRGAATASRVKPFVDLDPGSGRGAPPETPARDPDTSHRPETPTRETETRRSDDRA